MLFVLLGAFKLFSSNISKLIIKCKCLHKTTALEFMVLTNYYLLWPFFLVNKAEVTLCDIFVSLSMLLAVSLKFHLLCFLSFEHGIRAFLLGQRARLNSPYLGW